MHVSLMGFVNGVVKIKDCKATAPPSFQKSLHDFIFVVHLEQFYLESFKLSDHIGKILGTEDLLLFKIQFVFLSIIFYYFNFVGEIAKTAFPAKQT